MRFKEGIPDTESALHEMILSVNRLQQINMTVYNIKRQIWSKVYHKKIHYAEVCDE